MDKVIAVVRARDGASSGGVRARCRTLAEAAGVARAALLVPDDPDPAAVVSLWSDTPLADPAALFPGCDVDAWRVAETVQWDYERDWPVGDPTPGVKRIAFLHRNRDLDRAGFARYWDEVHAPLARIHHPGLWRYAQNVVVERLTPGAEDLDGIAELSFRSRDDMERRMYDSVEGAAVIRRDVATFLDADRGSRALGVELLLEK